MSILKSHHMRAVALLFVLWMLFFWRVLTPITADQASFKQGDFSGQFVAFAAYQYERFADGEIPLWNPYNNGGMPFIADTQAAVFYPPRLLTLAIGTQTGGMSYYLLQLEAIAHVLALSLLMYLFVHRLTKSIWGALVAAIVASYGGFISGYPPLQLALLEAAIWLPLACWCVLIATENDKVRWQWLIFAGGALGLSWLAGHPQTSWFATYVLVAWLGYRVFIGDIAHRWIAFLGGISLMGIVTLGATAVAFLPGIQYLTLTVRSNLGVDAKGNGFPFQDIAQFIFPGSVSAFSPLYVGIPALILIFIAGRFRWRDSRFWLVLALFGLLLSFGANSAFYYGLYNPLPGLRFFRGQERAAFIVMNSLAILAGIGTSVLASWSSEQKTTTLTYFMNGLLALIVGLTLLIYVGWWGNIGDGFGALVGTAALSSMVMVAIYALVRWQITQSHPYVLPLLVALIVFELFSVNMDAETNYDSIPASEQLAFNPPPTVQSVFDDAPMQLYRVDGFRGLEANYGSLYGQMDMRGISPLFLDSTWQIVYRDYTNNPQAWEIFAVRYVYSGQEAFGSVETDVISTGTDSMGQVFVHELRDPRPFAHLVYDIAVVGSDGHARELLLNPNFQTRETIILQTEPSLALPDSAPDDASATITEFAPERIVVSVDTPENAILSLALVDYPGWKATLNGEQVDILRAYGSLSAVEIPAGEHEVIFTFAPRIYYIGAGMSILTWSIIGLTVVYGLLRRRIPADSVTQDERAS
ncbi:MAG: YfhO family protein [Chloroflexota bacterium]